MSRPEPPEVRDHWRQGLQRFLERRARTAALRAELAAARTAGLEARHRNKLRRARAGDAPPTEGVEMVSRIQTAGGHAVPVDSPEGRALLATATIPCRFCKTETPLAQLVRGKFGPRCRACKPQRQANGTWLVPRAVTAASPTPAVAFESCAGCGTPVDACSYVQNPAAGRGDCCARCDHPQREESRATYGEATP